MNQQGRGSNLTDEDRAKGGQNSHQSDNSSGTKGGSSQGKGNFGNHEEHAEGAGKQSSGNTGNSEEHADAGRKGGSE